MFIFWLIITVISIGGFAFTEWQITRALVKVIYRQEADFLVDERRKKQFLALRFLIGCFIPASLYFALTDFTRAEMNWGCWLIPTVVVGALTAFNTHQRIKYIKTKPE